MADQDWESGEESIEEGRNPTQERIDEEGGGSERPTDVEWEETTDQPHEGEEGQAPV
jgi:hypothetical protein